MKSARMIVVCGALAAGTFAFAGAARADDVALAKTCVDASAAQKIEVCTAALEGISKPNIIAVVLTLRGLAYQYAKQLDLAMQDLDRALTLAPDLAIALSARGGVYLEQRKLAEALADLNNSVARSPDFIPALHNRGRVHTAMGEYQKAIADFEAVIALDAASPWPYVDRGTAYAAWGKLDRALADYDRALQMHPRIAEALYRRGQVKIRMGDAAGGNADIAAAKAIESDAEQKYSAGP
jgi:tetratricopeptide (TPR) repeat protein